MKIFARENLKFFILLFLIACVLAVSYLFDLHERFSLETARDFILGMGTWAPLIYMISYAFTSIILFPASLLSTVSGSIWGPTLGTFYTVVGATIASTLPFGIARFLGREFVLKRVKNTKLEICERFAVRNGFATVLMMRLLPLFPWDVVNYASGLCGIRFRDYILATFLGIIPGSFTYNLIGASLGEPIDKARVAIIFIMVLVIGIITFLYKKKKAAAS